MFIRITKLLIFNKRNYLIFKRKIKWTNLKLKKKYKQNDFIVIYWKNGIF